MPILSIIKAKGLKMAMLAGLGLLALPAFAKDDPMAVGNLRLSYAIYLGGIHLMDSTTEFTRNGPVYHVTMRAGTQGLVRRLIPWDAELNSKGTLVSETIKPMEGTIITRWKDEPAKVEFHYENGKEVKTVFEPPNKDDKNEPVPEALRQSALDPLNGIVQMMTGVAYGKGCAQTVPVFDGHRRFDVIMQDKGTAQLKGDGYSPFSGPANKCEVQFAMRAGTRKDREGSHFWDDEKNGARAPVHIYLAKVKNGLPPLPVRAETDSFFGGVMVHLTNIEGGQAQTAAKTP
ncbi:MAG TPA: DUF3108 domain-containing protein [Alphaproteobacteria bacterium]|nr:DUF3108 domain-containing protein [Alphaproteobacteria bacterium]